MLGQTSDVLDNQIFFEQLELSCSLNFLCRLTPLKSNFDRISGDKYISMSITTLTIIVANIFK